MKSSQSQSAPEEARFWLNGRPHPWRPGLRLRELLEELGALGGGVAVERNREVVRKAAHAEVIVEPGDRIEVVRLVGGG